MRNARIARAALVFLTGGDHPATMRSALDVCGCFPTGRHYAGIADRLARTVTKVEGLSATLGASERWTPARLAVIDFETTGLSSDTDRIIEIGVATFEDGQLSGLENWLVDPGVTVSEEVLAITKIDPAELKKAPPIKDVIDAFRARIEGHLPVAYNASFDAGFLHSELRRLRQLPDDGAETDDTPPAFVPSVMWIDPLVWARELQKDERGMKLVNVCARLGIALDNAHRAASDAEATGKVLMALSEQMPSTYGELIRLQALYAGRQDVDHAALWSRRR